MEGVTLGLFIAGLAVFALVQKLSTIRAYDRHADPRDSVF